MQEKLDLLDDICFPPGPTKNKNHLVVLQNEQVQQNINYNLSTAD